MAPDVEELIKRVNTLTLDKNRLRQRLNQLNQGPGQSAKENPVLLSQHSFDSSSNNNQNILQRQSSSDDSHKSLKTSPSNSKSSTESQSNIQQSTCLVGGVQCSTSCEEDLLYINDLYKQKIDEYESKWNMLTSKCSAISAELNALQKHFAIINDEKKDLETKLKIKEDDCAKIKSELQTVVLNYEDQLGAMSEHLSMITNQVTLNDNLRGS